MIYNWMWHVYRVYYLCNLQKFKEQNWQLNSMISLVLQSVRLQLNAFTAELKVTCCCCWLRWSDSKWTQLCARRLKCSLQKTRLHLLQLTGKKSSRLHCSKLQCSPIPSTSCSVSDIFAVYYSECSRMNRSFWCDDAALLNIFCLMHYVYESLKISMQHEHCAFTLLIIIIN